MRSPDKNVANLYRSELAWIPSGSFLRFFAASLLGLGLDIGLAIFLNSYAGVALIPSAAASLLVAAVVMYFVHEFWTFREGRRRVSAARMVATVGSALAALALRSACLYSTSELIGLGDHFPALQFLSATGLSFVLNYVVVRRIVSNPRQPS